MILAHTEAVRMQTPGDMSTMESLDAEALAAMEIWKQCQ